MRSFVSALALGFLAVASIAANTTTSSAGIRPSSNAAEAVDSCIVEVTGDVNATGDVTSADIIALVNYLFRFGALVPCAGAANVNCSETITSADIIYLVNYVFKGGPQPCDVCQSESALTYGCVR